MTVSIRIIGPVPLGKSGVIMNPPLVWNDMVLARTNQEVQASVFDLFGVDNFNFHGSYPRKGVVSPPKKVTLSSEGYMAFADRDFLYVSSMVDGRLHSRKRIDRVV